MQWISPPWASKYEILRYSEGLRWSVSAYKCVIQGSVFPNLGLKSKDNIQENKGIDNLDLSENRKQFTQQIPDVTGWNVYSLKKLWCPVSCHTRIRLRSPQLSSVNSVLEATKTIRALKVPNNEIPTKYSQGLATTLGAQIFVLRLIL